MKRLICLLFCCVLTISGALAQDNFRHIYKSRLDITWGYYFFIIYANENGNALVLKGEFQMRNDGPEYSKVKTSKPFKLNNAKRYFAILRGLSADTLFHQRPSADSPWAEAYVDGHKIYEGSYMTRRAMDFQREILSDLPRGFNPFKAEGNPFFNTNAQ